MLNAECALFALEHSEVFAAQARDIVPKRIVLQAALAALPGVETFRSDANMVLVRLAHFAGSGEDVASTVFQRMKLRGVLVKNMAGFHPLMANCLRLTVGTATENQAMLNALKESLCQAIQ